VSEFSDRVLRLLEDGRLHLLPMPGPPHLDDLGAMLQFGCAGDTPAGERCMAPLAYMLVKRSHIDSYAVQFICAEHASALVADGTAVQPED
jgi:hypothetical protein